MMKKIGILYHPLIETAPEVAAKIAGLLTSRHISVWLGSSWETANARTRLNGTELILSIGGDGNILRCAQVVLGTNIPITGINLGRLGFMTELSVNEFESKFPHVLHGEGWIDERTMLEVRPPQPSGQPETVLHALNDVVVARGATIRVLNTQVSINGAKFTTYVADGVIVATATGSTGYALSAGGPILHPQAAEFLLSPLLPHLSLPYTMVLPRTSIISLEVSTPLPALLSIDGHISLPLENGSAVTIKESRFKIRFLRIHPEASFYTALEQKLRGRRDANPSR
ncbi:MAG: NAD(+)/NADH kinase [Chloroflexota bacterium]